MDRFVIAETLTLTTKAPRDLLNSNQLEPKDFKRLPQSNSEIDSNISHRPHRGKPLTTWILPPEMEKSLSTARQEIAVRLSELPTGWWMYSEDSQETKDGCYILNRLYEHFYLEYRDFLKNVDQIVWNKFLIELKGKTLNRRDIHDYIKVHYPLVKFYLFQGGKIQAPFLLVAREAIQHLMNWPHVIPQPILSQETQTSMHEWLKMMWYIFKI